MPADNHAIPNRLMNETSPYLLQHAYNPVDWWPWCAEAFEKAKFEDKPVFLSIGYSTCHWCHVMEDESFIDAQVADRLNADFVSIKVDKEERPDIDSVYMSVCQALTGSGGWPTTIFMTHEQKPFFAGTYFPKSTRYGRIGLLELMASVKEKWDKERHVLIESSDKITRALSGAAPASAAFMIGDTLGRVTSMPDKSAIKKAAAELYRSYDHVYGGFGGAPKFPIPHNLIFLLRCHKLGVSDDALGMAEHTLTQMYKGGIFDHIGGGFSRYSTDKKWLAPHFEKMLYDNALLASACTECFESTGNGLYKTVSEKIFLYLDREMTSDGGFFSAQDADSDGEEGKYYTFTLKEVHDILGKNDAEYFCRKYDITESGNFESKNIPNLIAQDDNIIPDERTQRMADRLYDYRRTRFKLHKDDKVLTSWNALTIAALAKAYRVFGEEKYLESADRALSFIFTNLSDGEGNFFISYRNGKAKGDGILDDYAFLAWACLELYEAALDLCYLEKAVGLAEKILSGFSDKAGGFFQSANGSERLLIRIKEQYDGAMPSGNSVAAYVFVKLAALTAEKRWLDASDKQLGFYSEIFERHPTACTFALLALMYKTYPAHELVCVLSDASDKDAVISALRDITLPQTSVLIKSPVEAERLAKIAPFTSQYDIPADKRYAFYLCSGGACAAPVYSLDEIKQILTKR